MLVCGVDRKSSLATDEQALRQGVDDLLLALLDAGHCAPDSWVRCWCAVSGVGLLDDRIGPKKVITISLIALVIMGLGIFFWHDGGKSVFWVAGLIMTMFVGPAQSASRSFLARLIPVGKAGEVFGLYATTNRVVSFLSPALFGMAISIGAVLTDSDNTQYWGILGIVLVLLAGHRKIGRASCRERV